MSTQEQLNANRTNAQSSTGPKTDEGKATSSQNAVKHGLFAKNDVISGEDLAFYEQHRQDIYDEYVPLTPSESVLTQRIASLTWRLMRADRLQTTVINTLVAAQRKANPPPAPRKFDINRMMKILHEKYEDPKVTISDEAIIIAGLVRFKNEPISTDPAVDEAMEAALAPPADNHICDAEIQLGTVIYNDFQGSAVIERLQSYEQRIESSLFKTMRQFHQFQAARIKLDAARDKMAFARFRAEDQAKRDLKEAEYASYCARGNGRDSDVDSNQNAQNEPNSDVMSITEMTYNRSRYAKEKRNESNRPPSPPNHQ